MEQKQNRCLLGMCLLAVTTAKRPNWVDNADVYLEATDDRGHVYIHVHATTYTVFRRQA